MARVNKIDPAHKVGIEFFPQDPGEGDGQIGTCIRPTVRLHIQCAGCGMIHTSNSECPHCGRDVYIQHRKLTENEIALAEVVGIDHTDEANWDRIENIATIACELYGADY